MYKMHLIVIIITLVQCQAVQIYRISKSITRTNKHYRQDKCLSHPDGHYGQVQDKTH